MSDDAPLDRFPWTDDMREVSGFGKHGADGKRYEDACRAMVSAGVAWLTDHPEATLTTLALKSYANVTGLVWSDTDEGKAFLDAVAGGCDGPSGAMVQHSAAHALRAHRLGWALYQVESREMNAKEGDA